ncbi:hypothetical protein D3C85_1032120 [compost metagenome]
MYGLTPSHRSLKKAVIGDQCLISGPSGDQSNTPFINSTKGVDSALISSHSAVKNGPIVSQLATIKPAAAAIATAMMPTGVAAKATPNTRVATVAAYTATRSAVKPAPAMARPLTNCGLAWTSSAA